MKFCSKCGNPMEDDMLFCQKCGTKFIEIVDSSIREIELKIAQMEKYNLVLDAQTISWEYLREDGARAGNICVKQDKLCEELVALVKDILSSADEEEKYFVEREVYSFVLQMGYKMCKEGEKLFANYSGFKELFELGSELVSRGQLAPTTFFAQMMEQDQIYKAVAGLQGLHCSRIKEALSEDVIYGNMEFRSLTMQLAQAFNDMWIACVKRYTDFFMSLGEPFMNQNWEIYTVLLKGLHITDIDSLNERGWSLALDDWEKNQKGGRYKREFLRKRDEERNEMRKVEQEKADKQYWETHPEELRMLEVNRTRISELNAEILVIEKEINLLENAKRPIDVKKSTVEKAIVEKKQLISKLSRKIFGKKKAEVEIEVLNGDITMLAGELEVISNQIQEAEKPIAECWNRKMDLNANIRKLEQDNIALRNK